MTDPTKLHRLFADQSHENDESRYPVRGVVKSYDGNTLEVLIPAFDGGVHPFEISFTDGQFSANDLILVCKDEADTYWLVGTQYPSATPSSVQTGQPSGPGTNDAGGGSSGPASKGGWVKVGATWDTWWEYGIDEPTFAGRMACGASHYSNGFSFAELLVAGANAGLSSQSLGAIFKTGTPMPCGTKLHVRMPNSSKMFTIQKADVGSGQAGDAHYKIDLHPEIAWALLGDQSQSHTAWGNQDVEVKLA